MALRPLSRTVSSLTGIVVLVAALWFLLNFVWAPSCGRFACSYTPSWWPQAEADSGDSCPENIAAAAGDATWAAGRYATIKDAKITTGLFYDADGSEHRIESGRDADSERVLAVLYEIGVVQPPVRPNVVDHVETKVAALMRAEGLTSGVLVINFPRGVCGTEAPQPYSCAAIVPAILPDGATLAVWSPREIDEGRPSVKLTGDAR
ncbi:MAG TPA: DddA-like double-stranded DNA deaminase toxin [Actinophytocola sp.]|uniref:DddA-like double-stranded DNA deaminase toxin n=1 Tax=Actinophytocola sp. TaxID=1872138 RepID=UPI002DDCF5B6|nr:DddA-like double-stranded DNA deaminase toxin [Actinophytocola sp.]HEV2777873.1 DddA-like double-stranded DNA deaminase toxin [Actinophytocola sp.]